MVEDEGLGRPMPPFPALDPEPPPRRPARRWAVRVLLVVLAGGGAWWAWPTAGSPTAPSGQVIVLTPSGLLGLVSMSGGRVRVFGDLGTFLGQPPAVGPDGRSLVTASGHVVDVAGGRLVSEAGVSRKLGLGGGVPDVAPLADGGRAVVVLTDAPQGYQEAASLVWLHGRRRIALGGGLSAVGDPRSRGLFVVVGAAVPVAESVPVVGTPATKVQLRVQGRPPLTLATAPEMGRELGFPAGLPLRMSLFPSPAGRDVAVTVGPDTLGASSLGLVVLSRAGRVLRVVPRVPLLAPPAWSPNGRFLAYAALGHGGEHLVVAGPDRRTRQVTVPPGAAGLGCVWATDGAALLCEDSAPPGVVTSALAGRPEWLVVGAGGGTVTRRPAAGFPLSWLAEGGVGAGLR